jgi:Uma2 family endonuclease
VPRSVDPVLATPEPAPNRIRWTRLQSSAIRDAEILTGRYELIDGEIISKMGQKPPHRICVVLLTAYLSALFGTLFVQVQSTIDVGDADPDHNEPEPDLAVTRQPATAYSDCHPGPVDLVLVVEVSDTTLRFDRSVKAALYARARIPEYWLLDIAGRQVFVYRRPDPGGYAEAAVYSAEESIATLARADVPVAVADLLPPA